MAKGNGHGSIILDDDGEGSSMVYVHNNGGNSNYSTGFHTAENQSGETLVPGDVVFVDWGGSGIIIKELGNRAIGNVSAEGTQIAIVEAGDTDLSGTVDISETYGDNGGFGGQNGVTCANVNGEAEFLA